jgi:hypothetical protein
VGLHGGEDRASDDCVSLSLTISEDTFHGDDLRKAIAEAFASSGLSAVSNRAENAAQRKPELAAQDEHDLTTVAGVVDKVLIYQLFRVPELIPPVIVDARRSYGLAPPVDLFRGSWGALPRDLRDEFTEDLSAIHGGPNARADAAEGFDTDSASDSEDALEDDEDGDAPPRREKPHASELPEDDDMPFMTAAEMHYRRQPAPPAHNAPPPQAATAAPAAAADDEDDAPLIPPRLCRTPPPPVALQTGAGLLPDP